MIRGEEEDFERILFVLKTQWSLQMKLQTINCVFELCGPIFCALRYPSLHPMMLGVTPSLVSNWSKSNI